MSEKIGPYELDSIYTGECSRLMASLPDGCIDLTVTSPPYDNLRTYNGYVFNFEAIAQQLWRVTKAGGAVVWVVGDETKNGSETGTSFRQALYFMGLGFNLHDTMIFHKKPIPSVAIMQKRYEQEFEFMFVFSKGIPGTCNHLREKKLWEDRRITKRAQRNEAGKETTMKTGKGDDKIKGNVWRYSVGGGHVTNDKFAHAHPAIFPEALARDHILSWSNPGDLVLDPMCGSGTTCKMAKEQGRRWLGFDISAEYVELARLRVEGGRIPLFTLQPNGAINA